MMDIDANVGAEVILRTKEGKETAVDLYSQDGIELLTALRLKQMAQFKTMYEPTSLGMRLIQVPNDIVAMQELIWKVQPDAIVEIGIAHGGSLVMYAGLCELIGKGKVLGIDVEIREENRVNIEKHVLFDRIELLEYSSLRPEAVQHAKQFCLDAEEIIVILDSNHTTDHVRQEMDLYSDLVSANGYLVVMDGGQAFVSDIPRGNADWKLNNPLTAVHQFVKENDGFEIDPHFTRFGVTSCPDGFLRRKYRAP
jgi:cephalosporin hydroxylase